MDCKFINGGGQYICTFNKDKVKNVECTSRESCILMFEKRLAILGIFKNVLKCLDCMLNTYDQHMVNTIINRFQTTVTWYIYDLKDHMWRIQYCEL